MEHHQTKNLLSKILKIAIVGDSGVGKSEFISSYMHIVKNYGSNNPHDKVPTKQVVVKPTIAVDDHIIRIPYDDDNDVNIVVYDTSGKSQYKNIYKEFLRHCHCIIIMFDLSSPLSISNVFSWLDFTLSSINNTSSPISIFIVGNKNDKFAINDILSTECRIDNFMRNLSSYEEQLCYRSIVKNYFYNECSAKTHENVEEIMNYLILYGIDE
jgi:GTPase SAR1 family protein